MRKSGKFILNMTLLSASSLLLGLAATFFRVWVTKYAGAEVVGLHELLYAVYGPACTLACSGINLAVTRLVASREASGTSLKSIVSKSLAYSVSFGVAAAVLLYFSAPFFESYVLKEEGVAACFRILAFGLPFLSSASALHGAFTAMRKVYKSVIVQATEDLSKIAVTALCMCTILRDKSPAEMCKGLVIGSATAETFSCVVAVILYLFDKERKGCSAGEKGITRRIFAIAMPTAASSYARAALSAFENLMIPIGLRKNGMMQSAIYAKLGVLRGMTFPILTFPSFLFASCSRLLVPEISEAFETGDRSRIVQTAEKMIKLTLSFAFIVMFVFLFFGEGIALTVFGNYEAGIMLRLMAPLVPMIYLDGIVDAMLKGINEQLASMRFNIIDSAVSAVATTILLPEYGFEGYFVITYVTVFLNAFLSLNRLLTRTKMKLSATECVALPFAFASFSALLPCIAVKYGVMSGTTGPVLSATGVFLLLMITHSKNKEGKTKNFACKSQLLK